jgi:hypothetical protein
LKTKIQHQNQANKTNHKSDKWATSTYYSSKIRKITNLFKHTDIKIAFQSTNTIQQRIRPRHHNATHDHNKSCVYKMVCKTRNKAYIGQTSRNLTLRFREHIRYIRNNDPQPAYAQHILHNIHENGTLADSMILLKPIQNIAMVHPNLSAK